MKIRQIYNNEKYLIKNKNNKLVLDLLTKIYEYRNWSIWTGYNHTFIGKKYNNPIKIIDRIDLLSIGADDFLDPILDRLDILS